MESAVRSRGLELSQCSIHSLTAVHIFFQGSSNETYLNDIKRKQKCFDVKWCRLCTTSLTKQVSKCAFTFPV